MILEVTRYPLLRRPVGRPTFPRAASGYGANPAPNPTYAECRKLAVN